MPKKVLVAMSPAMLEQVDFTAQCEHRTRSDLIREALRRYLDNFRRSNSISVQDVKMEGEPVGLVATV
jgi:metal-responsive CopG/Arc/MetJ family transcriptional regulator